MSRTDSRPLAVSVGDRVEVQFATGWHAGQVRALRRGTTDGTRREVVAEVELDKGDRVAVVVRRAGLRLAP